jgi:hypothetical protein
LAFRRCIVGPSLDQGRGSVNGCGALPTRHERWSASAFCSPTGTPPLTALKCPVPWPRDKRRIALMAPPEVHLVHVRQRHRDVAPAVGALQQEQLI